MSSPLILRSKATSSTWIFSFMIIIFSNQMHKVSIIFWRCLYKKEYEPKVIIIRSKLSLTILQVKKSLNISWVSHHFLQFLHPKKNSSPDDPRSICQKSYTCINPYIGKANFFMISRDWKLHFLQIALVFFKIKAVFFFFQYENKTQKVSFFLHLLCYWSLWRHEQPIFSYVVSGSSLVIFGIWMSADFSKIRLFRTILKTKLFFRNLNHTALFFDPSFSFKETVSVDL